MPIGKDTATLNEVIVDSDVNAYLIEINAIEINKAIPDFNCADTLRISEDGWVVRLPDWYNLYVIEVAGDRDSAIVTYSEIPVEGVYYNLLSEENIGEIHQASPPPLTRYTISGTACYQNKLTNQNVG